ncbi:uncharacterized protein LOC134747443 [Cydia strobilella]|uniref:uncharacterized protein LOC134747443 n=1 Tax=Cydia strobilella TaxID=1100964 RepID=UPI003003BF74
MASLVSLLEELRVIRDSIVKLGKDKRQTVQGRNKLLLAQDVKRKFDLIIADICEKEVAAGDLDVGLKTAEDFECLFLEIQRLVRADTVSKMADFDLKTALSLLPVADVDENQINQLIDGVQFYSSTLKENDQTVLINFVVKTRLSSKAKLKIKNEYVTVTDLISDIKKYLLPKKSYTAILSQLQRCRQGNRSIEDFGNEVEQLFTNLTLTQADGNSVAHDILRPINEKTAIRRFAEGLNSDRISTIIASRAIESIREAITVAVDESEVIQKPAASCFQFSKRPFEQNRGYLGSNNNKQYFGQRTFYPRNNNNRFNFARSGYRGPIQQGRGQMNFHSKQKPSSFASERNVNVVESTAVKKEVEKQIRKLLDEDIIEECTSEWSSPLLLLPKKLDSSGEKKWRIVIDYRLLNKKIVDEKFPLPNMQEILDSLSGCVYFSHLDLSSG